MAPQKKLTPKKIPLPGDLVRDRVTQLEGIVVARTQHLNMCDRYTVQPRVQKGSKEAPEYPNAYAIDVGDLSVVEENAAGLSPEERARWHQVADSIAGAEEAREPQTGGPTSVVRRPPVHR